MVWAKDWFSRRKNEGTTKPLHEDVPASPDPRFEEWILQGNVLEDNRDYEGALARYREASRLEPDIARGHVNIGNALQLMGRLDEAILAQETAVRLAPDYPAAHYNLGALLARKRETARAERALREALRLRPEMADAAIVLADVLGSAGRVEEAEGLLRSALAAMPQSAMAAHNLAILLIKQDRVDDAEDLILRARSSNPGLGSLDAVLATIYVKTGRARESAALFQAALTEPACSLETVSAYLFSLNCRDDLDAEGVFREHRKLGATFGATAVSKPTATPANPERPLRIGYVSADLRQHPVGLFMRPVLERHDRAMFEVHCYANHSIDDDFTRTLRHSVEHWHSIAGVDDATVADQIRADKIDILVDLAGHTTDSRLSIFASRPAPVQVTWLGYLNTTGLGVIDYRICDRHTDPAPSSERLHTERLLRLPHSQWCYQPVYQIAPVDRPHSCDPDVVVFGSFNQNSKISEACIALWCSVLASLPQARIRIYGVAEGRTGTALRERLEHSGIDSSRISLHGRLGILDYFAAIGDVDIALDSFPYNGATTTLDTLWMGVPLVALAGSRAISRGSASILSTLGAPELIAATPEAFVELNVRLANDAAWRLELRRSLRTRLEGSPIMDAPTFVRDLETRYREIWRDWCERQAAQS